MFRYKYRYIEIYMWWAGCPDQYIYDSVGVPVRQLQEGLKGPPNSLWLLLPVPLEFSIPRKWMRMSLREGRREGKVTE